jgi:hypothetical protein
VLDLASDAHRLINWNGLRFQRAPMCHSALSSVTHEGCSPLEFVKEDPMGKASRRKKIPQSFVATLPASLSNLPFVKGRNPYGKISASLLDLIDPYADDDLPLDTMRKLVVMGVVAWNIASTSNTLDEAAAELDRFISDTPALGASAGTAAQDFRVAVLGLVRRKRLLFPQDKRLVTSYELSRERSGLHLRAAAVQHG